MLFPCSYLQDSLDLVRALDRHPLKPAMVGAAMIGPQNVSAKQELGPLLDGIVNYDYRVAAPSLAFEGVAELLETSRSRSAWSDMDGLGHHMAPLACAQMQVVAHAVERTQSLDDAALSEFTRGATFPTVMGDVTFGMRGDWTRSCVLQVQYQGIEGHGLDQVRGDSRQVVVAPREMASGSLIYPFAKARTSRRAGGAHRLPTSGPDMPLSRAARKISDG